MNFEHVGGKEANTMIFLTITEKMSSLTTTYVDFHVCSCRRVLCSAVTASHRADGVD